VAGRIIDGKALAERVRAAAAAEARRLAEAGVIPGLAVVLIGEDPASQVYVRNKSKACREAGLNAFDHRLPAETSEADLLQLIARLNDDPSVDGILVQLPLPKHISSERVLEAISPDKDVDGFHAVSVGHLWTSRPGFVPCTPQGVMRLIAEAGTQVRGAEAVVIGRSNIVGRPMAALLLSADATVTVCHSRTADLPGVARRADILIAAIGKANFVRGDWVKPGATVIDVGMNRGPDGKLCGDVAFAEAVERARAITPVPGGVGPMTIAMLVESTVRSAARRLPGERTQGS
jgi:methylenetetrahydrofolate dehydrogenase (NADP+)/methenyltetrahydrofolate cyclohydrolase